MLDAENAARDALAGHAKSEPKSADGVVEMLRQIKIAKDTAVKARTAAMIALKSVLVTVNRPGSGGEPEATGEWFRAGTEEVPTRVA